MDGSALGPPTPAPAALGTPAISGCAVAPLPQLSPPHARCCTHWNFSFQIYPRSSVTPPHHFMKLWVLGAWGGKPVLTRLQ